MTTFSAEPLTVVALQSLEILLGVVTLTPSRLQLALAARISAPRTELQKLVGALIRELRIVASRRKPFLTVTVYIHTPYAVRFLDFMPEPE